MCFSLSAIQENPRLRHAYKVLRIEDNYLVSPTYGGRWTRGKQRKADRGPAVQSFAKATANHGIYVYTDYARACRAADYSRNCVVVRVRVKGFRCIAASGEIATYDAATALRVVYSGIRVVDQTPRTWL